MKWWRGQDSNLRTHKRAELQSAAFNHSTTPPRVQPAHKMLIANVGSEEKVFCF